MKEKKKRNIFITFYFFPFDVILNHRRKQKKILKLNKQLDRMSKGDVTVREIEEKRYILKLNKQHDRITKNDVTVREVE